MMFFDPPHYRKRNLQKRTGFLNDFKSEGMDRRVFRLSRIDRTEIQVGGTLCLRLQCLFSGMGRAADDQVRGKSDRLFQRKIVLPDMDAVRAGQEGDVDMVVHNHCNIIAVADFAELFRQVEQFFFRNALFPQLNQADSRIRSFFQDTQCAASCGKLFRYDQIKIRFTEFCNAFVFHFTHDFLPYIIPIFNFSEKI